MNKRWRIIIVVIGFLFAISKGWGSAETLPFWVIASPLLWYELKMFERLKRASRSVSLIDRVLLYAYPIMYLLALICEVAVDDTQQYVAFGFFSVRFDSFVSNLSHVIALTAGAIFVLLSFYVLPKLYSSTRARKA